MDAQAKGIYQVEMMKDGEEPFPEFLKKMLGEILQNEDGDDE